MRRSPISAPALAPVTNVNCGRVPRTLSSNVPKKQRSSCIRREAEITAEETTDPARLVFIDETSTNTAMVRLRGRCPRGIRLIDQCAARALEDDQTPNNDRPVSVGTMFFPWAIRKPCFFSPPMISARVAGVPMPLASLPIPPPARQ